jgi:hypothetical protein
LDLIGVLSQYPKGEIFINDSMARKKREKELKPNITVRLDRRTIITVRDHSKLEFWKEKYPGLEILEESYQSEDDSKKETEKPKKPPVK